MTHPSSPTGEPEYLSPGGPATGEEKPARRARRTGVIVASGVGVAAALTLGGWGVVQLMSGGSSAAEALPQNTVGYLSVDLDPSATQKIEAIRMLQKFPGLEKELDLDARDDLRRWIFEKGMAQEPDCTIDFATDIEPWLGYQLAVAAVPDSDQPLAPVFALEVTDREAARAGLRTLGDCGDPGNPPGKAFVGDYMLLTDDQDDADAFAAAAEAGSLADSESFRQWTDRVGGAGIINAYVSSEAPRLMARAMDEGDAAPMIGFGDEELSELARRTYRDFEGMAATVRFADGGIETELVTRGLAPAGALASGGPSPSLGSLPASTALAFGFGVPEGWVQDVLDQVDGFFGVGTAGAPSLDEVLAEAEAQTGLTLPEDLQTLLGDAVTVSVDGGVDLDELTGPAADPRAVPLGVTIEGDPDEIRPVLDKLLTAAGPAADQLAVRATDEAVFLGLRQEYVDTLAQGGSLGDQDSFRRVVPEADRVSGAFYLDFDAGEGWAEQLGALLSDDDPEVAANLAPLDALGMSGWTDESGVQHSVVALTTD